MVMNNFLFSSVFGRTSGNKGKTGFKKDTDEDTGFFLGILADTMVILCFLFAILTFVQSSLKAGIFPKSDW